MTSGAGYTTAGHATANRMSDTFRNRDGREPNSRQGRALMTKIERYTCHDCGCIEGQNHNDIYCDMALCPRCGHQRISCDCKGVSAKLNIPFILYPNMCAKCGVLWPEMFHVSDDEWRRYVEPAKRHKMLCRSCFDQIKAWIDECRASHG
jgi:hypothetical protein